jgi:hypothetical protein
MESIALAAVAFADAAGVLVVAEQLGALAC